MIGKKSQLRKRSGMSLRQLSQACGVSVSRLSLFERGERGLHAHELATISAILRERLDETPRFADTADVEEFLAKGDSDAQS